MHTQEISIKLTHHKNEHSELIQSIRREIHSGICVQNLAFHSTKKLSPWHRYEFLSSECPYMYICGVWFPRKITFGMLDFRMCITCFYSQHTFVFIFNTRKNIQRRFWFWSTTRLHWMNHFTLESMIIFFSKILLLQCVFHAILWKVKWLLSTLLICFQ